MPTEILVLYCSPGGTTAEMANIIARGVEEIDEQEGEQHRKQGELERAADVDSQLDALTAIRSDPRSRRVSCPDSRFVATAVKGTGRSSMARSGRSSSTARSRTEPSSTVLRLRAKETTT